MKHKEKQEIIDKIINRKKTASPVSSFKLKIITWKFTIFFSYLLKRAFDLTVSAIMIVFLFPFFVLLSVMIYIESPGPVIFRQIRVGKDGKHFQFYKFRSMVVNAEALKAKLEQRNESKDGVIFKMKNDPRITRIGKFIRKTSIDELPQLYNVLIGDMSLVGPRPPVPKEVAEYSLNDRKRLHITPGITCIWQISGRSEIPFNEQVKLDKDYIQSQSFISDIIILFKTIPAILFGKGAY